MKVFAQESTKRAGLATRTLHVPKKDLSSGLVFVWLLEDQL